jgi:hypothetical protein
MKVLEPACLGRLCGRIMVMSRRIAISWRAIAAGARDHLLNLTAVEQLRMVANANDVVRPIKLDTHNMRLRTQRLLDRIRTGWAMQRIKPKYVKLFRLRCGVFHGFPLAGSLYLPAASIPPDPCP